VFFAGGTVTSRHVLKEETIQNSQLKLQRSAIFPFKCMNSLMNKFGRNLQKWDK